MSGPWFIETLARNGEVLQRCRVDALPIRIGRGYDNDFIIDDDYVAASHARIEMDAAGRLLLRDLDSKNGLDHRGRRLREVVLSGETVVRIGHTTLRVRAAGFPVAPEREDRTFHRWEGTLPGSAGMLLGVGAALFLRWLSDTRYFEFGRYVEAAAWGIGAALLWSGAWALLNRLFGRHARLGRHLFVFGCGLVALVLTALLLATAAYAWSLEALTRYASHAAVLLVAGMVYFHLCTVSPQHRRRYRWSTAGMALLVSSLILISNLQRSGRLADELYMPVLLPPALRVSPDYSVDVFMRGVEDMQAPLDRERGRRPGEHVLEN